MERKQIPTFIIILIAIFAALFIFISSRGFDLPEGETVEFIEEPTEEEQTTRPPISLISNDSELSDRGIFITEGVQHSIPLEDIRTGCFGRDCIPSVDDPEYITVSEADELLPDDTVGIGLSLNGIDRFYPFNMLVTREIVNDTIGDAQVVVTYCPLCGTGVVYNRNIGGEVFEFGVSGLLWQSNLLMYNRDDNDENVSLWSQVLGESVLGMHTGVVLEIIPSDILRYTTWRESNQNGEVLNTGRIGDPYNGDYYGVARNFRPDFIESESPLPPTDYVYGLELDGKYKAYPRDVLEIGETTDTFNDMQITIIRNSNDTVRFFKEGDDTPLGVLPGFWFSWVAAHPETELFIP